ncbi:MAG: metal ABC transporter ATP-binding protein, partial [Pauljensenia sp.]|nr:metal ABC transporter ATP-binding protein [Pauljensenia sp.]
MMTTDTTTTAGTSHAEAPAVVRLDNLHVAWDTDLILHGITLSIPAGQTVAITGSNGSGKSTTLKALLGTAPITSGDALLFSRSITARRRVPWQKIGYVPQRISSGGAVSSSAIEVVRSGLLGPRRLWAMPGDTARAMDALERVGMAHRAHSPMNILSGGQAQRVLIARALVRRPELLIMDEPMAGIDAASRARLASIVADAKAEGTTILIVLHELGELGPLLDRELHISAGHVSYDGAPHIDDDHE